MSPRGAAPAEAAPRCALLRAQIFASMTVANVAVSGGCRSRRTCTLCLPDGSFRIEAVCERPVNVTRHNRLRFYKLLIIWRRGSESNRRRRLCRPLHDHSATPPGASSCVVGRAARANEKGEPPLPATVSPIGKWSGKRVSNSRPQPWQGCALPTELFPRRTTTNCSTDSIAVKTQRALSRGLRQSHLPRNRYCAN